MEALMSTAGSGITHQFSISIWRSGFLQDLPFYLLYLSLSFRHQKTQEFFWKSNRGKKQLKVSEWLQLSTTDGNMALCDQTSKLCRGFSRSC